MKYEIQKISRIVDEILDFFMTHASNKINISIENATDKYIIIVETDKIECDDEKINQLKELLNVQRQREIEEYCWELAGDDIEGEEFNLVGMMIDEANVEYKYPSLKIRLVRNKK